MLHKGHWGLLGGVGSQGIGSHQGASVGVGCQECIRGLQEV